MSKPKRIAFLLHSLEGGGIQRVVLNLLKEMLKYNAMSLDLVVASADGPYLEQVPAGVRVIDLHTSIEFRAKSLIRLVPAIAEYLRREKPDTLLSHLPYANVFTVIAKALSGIPVDLVLIEHTFLYHKVVQLESLPPKTDKYKRQLLPSLMPIMMRWFYPKANAIITVSQGMARELERDLKLQPDSVKVIYNPVVDESLLLKSNSALNDPWFQPNQPPVLIAVGRLAAQKDYPSLLHAFARFREQRVVRLLILGDGEARSQLEALVHKLGIDADVLLPGFVQNPYAYISRASALVLSSLWEGLPTVLIEAMACGCQVISTDCTYGPDEILEQGKYGWLVPVGDVSALATAMQEAIDSPKKPDELRHRAQNFRIEEAVSGYLKIINLNQS
ncbi:MAG TPA: glycosyl transferase [Cyanobacteria bacterium UBA12227]|nr:glycosyl transferase [Cyanobacteria bacterium UBA12227]HAX89502.1 glycosyl transferase [Cyanobacteria bacterium UBA11370]HBY81616.1 glycosyl transferase [Cyanobacteria bacterium UBA11148]